MVTDLTGISIGTQIAPNTTARHAGLWVEMIETEKGRVVMRVGKVVFRGVLAVLIAVFFAIGLTGCPDDCYCGHSCGSSDCGHVCDNSDCGERDFFD